MAAKPPFGFGPAKRIYLLLLHALSSCAAHRLTSRVLFAHWRLFSIVRPRRHAIYHFEAQCFQRGEQFSSRVVEQILHDSLKLVVIYDVCEVLDQTLL